MKVLSIVPYTIFPARTGGQKAIALFNRYFARHGELVCATVPGNDPAFAEGYTMVHLLGAGRFRYINPRSFFTLRRFIRQEGFTHLLLEHPYFGWLGVLLKKATGVRLVTRSHNIEATRWKSLGKWWWKGLYYYERWTHRHSDYNFFITEEDRTYALRRYGLDAASCLPVPYGIEWDRAPDNARRQTCRQQLCNSHGIDPASCILLFNGAFGYRPNRDALFNIVHQLAPRLRQTGFHFTIVICGKDIPAGLANTPGLVIAGFVDDVASYFMGADLFLNPVTEGGGIKTKLVEALGYNLTAVSAQSGASGIPQALCDGKLLVCDDGDWQQFAERTREAANIRASIPQAYFDHFYWDNIGKKAADFLKQELSW